MCGICTQCFDSVLKNDGYDHRIRVYIILVCHIILKLTRVVNIFLRDPNAAIHVPTLFPKTFILFSK